MTFSAFIFDYNGVLVDDEHVHWAAFRQVLRPMGIEMSQADYWEKYLGFDDLGAFRAVLRDHGRTVSDSETHALVELKKPAYLALAKDSLRGFDGAGALLRRLAAAGTLIGIVSGALRNEIELGLEVLDVKDAVRFIVAAEDTQASKPDPEGYVIGKQHLLTLAGPDVAARALVIEDSMAGIEAAVGAGLFCLAVAHSYDAAQLRAAGAIDVVARIADINDEYLAQLAARVGV
jgi:beta-phosphoglucomutase